MIRKAVFWTHLCCGVATGIVVFTMSITGVLLMYERQLLAWANEQDYLPAAEQGERLPLEQLITMQKIVAPDVEASAVVIENDPGAPVNFRAGRRGGTSLNPYTGEVMETGSPRLEAILGDLRGFHRWFNVEGENRAIARQVTGVSNVVFLFLVLSGMYLWLPKLYSWTMFRARLLFRGDYPNGKARDFHWHHIFGIWSAIPLIAVVYTGAVISYPWAANFMYRVFGAEVPAAPSGPPGGQQAQRGGGGGGQQDRIQDGSAGEVDAAGSRFLTLDTLVERALAHEETDWRRLTLTLPAANARSVAIEIDEGNGAQAQLRHTLTLERSSGELLSVNGFSDMPLQQRLRTTARFLHTGEVLGFWGQTIAGLVSFASLFLVWTGFALSYRRLIVPLFRKT